MTCREVIDFLADYLADALAPSQRAAFDAHLQRCPECVAYLRSYAATVKVGKHACTGSDVRSDAVPEELVQAILAARGKRN